MKKRKKRNSYLCYVIYEGPQLCTLLGEIWGLKKSLKKSCQCAKNARDSLLERRYWTELPKTKRRFSDLVSKSRAFRPLLCRQSDQILAIFALKNWVVLWNEIMSCHKNLFEKFLWRENLSAIYLKVCF